jgi:glycosyltransferase involved in cell wall biosynthesis
VLWINDVTYAPLIHRTGWPALYDVTDDWLLAPFSEPELERLRRLDELALRDADEVVVCSQSLAASRGSSRDVVLIPNGVDVEHLRRPQQRPPDLPPSPVAVYVGSLHESRLDVGVVAKLAQTHPSLNIAFVGPNGLTDESTDYLTSFANVSLLGPRPYSNVPGYLQHASVIVVPHLVSPFTESLDPIKAYECLAVTTPTVATPVAGFREHPKEFHLASGAEFVAAVATVLSSSAPVRNREPPASWLVRAAAFEAHLLRASHSPRNAPGMAVPGGAAEARD